MWRGLHSGLLPAQAEAEVLVKEQGLGDPAWSNPTSDLWLPEPSLPPAVVPLALTGGALLGGMAASRETVTVTPGSPEEWAQARADAGIRLPKARAWLLSMLGWGGRSQCRQGTCNGCLPGRCPERASSSPKKEGWGPGPHVHGMDPPQHDITGRNICSEAQLLMASSKLRPKASEATVAHISPRVQRTRHGSAISLLPSTQPRAPALSPPPLILPGTGITTSVKSSCTFPYPRKLELSLLQNFHPQYNFLSIYLSH